MIKKRTNSIRYIDTYLFQISFAQDTFEPKQLTFNSAQNGFTSWSLDGKRIAFNSTSSGNFDVWIMGVDIEQLKKELKELNK